MRTAIIALALLWACNALSVEIEYTCPQTCEPISCDVAFNGIYAECDTETRYTPFETECNENNLGQSFVQDIDYAPGQQCTLQYFNHCDGFNTLVADTQNVVDIPLVLPGAPTITAEYAGNLGVMPIVHESNTAPDFITATDDFTPSNDTLTLDKPSGTVEGDFLTVHTVTDAAGGEFATPSGWTESVNIAVLQSRTQVFTKFAGPSEPATYDFTLENDNNTTVIGGSVHRWSGVDNTTPLDGVTPTTDTGTGTTITCPTLTTNTDNAVVVRLFGEDDNNYTDDDSPAAHTTVYALSSSVGADVSMGFAYATQASAGSAGTADFTGTTGGGEDWAAATMVLKPAAGGGETVDVAISESFSLSNQQSLSSELGANVDESLGFGDSQAVASQLLAAVSETVSLADTQSAVRSLLVSLSETFALTEQQSSSLSLVGSISEDFNFTDSQSAIASLLASVSEQLQLVDQQSGILSLNASIGETFSLVDAQQTGQIIAVSIAESFSLTESQTITLQLNALIGEIFTFSDSAAVSAQLTAALQEGLSLDDSLAAQSSVLAAIQETLALVDSQSVTSSADISASNRIVKIQAIDRFVTIDFVDRVVRVDPINRVAKVED